MGTTLTNFINQFPSLHSHHETTPHQHSVLVGDLRGVYRAGDGDDRGIGGRRVWICSDLGTDFFYGGVLCAAGGVGANYGGERTRTWAQAMRSEYGSSRSGMWLIGLALVAIVSGCAAFEAGNILGAVAGISLINSSVPVPVIVLLIGAIAAVLLWKGTVQQIAKLLGVIVA